MELAHRTYEAFNRRDWDTFLALMDEEVVDPFWQPIRWVDGKCVWWRNCSTEAEALEAIGDPE